jgi:hypothetical protein
VRLKVREALVRSRVNAMNTVRFLVKSLGLQVPRGVKATAFVRKFRLQASATDTALVEPLLQTLDALNTRIKELDHELAELADARYPATQRLRQVPGVGPLTALGFVLTIEDPARFPQTRDVGAYLGLVPRRDQSGLTDKQLPITKRGNVQLRCLLVNCAHYILGPFGPPSALRAAGERIAAAPRTTLHPSLPPPNLLSLQVTSLGHCDLATACASNAITSRQGPPLLPERQRIPPCTGDIDVTNPSAYGSLTDPGCRGPRPPKPVTKMVNHFKHSPRHAFSWKPPEPMPLTRHGSS